MTLHAEIEIHCSPEEVRKIFLEFPAYPSWTSGFIKSITPATPAPDSDPTKLVPGTKLTAALQGMTVKPTLRANNATEFRWVGKLWDMPGLFTGEHSFRFEASATGTRFIHSENFSGILSFLIREGTGFWNQTKAGFEGFNADLKRRCEAGEK